jgi:flagellar motility protein MotE (MotC chaperone)
MIELVKSYGLAIHDDRKDALPDDVVKLGMCGHYYVLGGRDNNEIKHHFEEELRIRCKEIDDKNELIEELRQKIEDLESENKSLDFKYYMIKTIGYGRHIIPLKEKIQTLEKKNKDLKDLLEKNEGFGKYVGERVADSIREGYDKGVYELHPLTRIDIHVEETNNMPMTFARHAIPRISVIFNNTQTEMERDTAEHECEELDKKFKELVKENEELRMILAMCERDANTAKNLCHTVAFNAERARNKTPWFNDEPCNICTTKYALKGDDI